MHNSLTSPQVIEHDHFLGGRSTASEALAKIASIVKEKNGLLRAMCDVE
jgi:hypothetical protein